MGFFKRKAAAGEVLRCSFCNKSQTDVKKLIAGPTVYICNECVDICVDIIRETEEPHSFPESKCTLCKTSTSEAEGLQVENRGWLCPRCISAIQNALATKPG